MPILIRLSILLVLFLCYSCDFANSSKEKELIKNGWKRIETAEGSNIKIKEHKKDGVKAEELEKHFRWIQNEVIDLEKKLKNEPENFSVKVKLLRNYNFLKNNIKTKNYVDIIDREREKLSFMDVLAMLDAAYFLGEDKLAEQYAEIAVSRIEKSKKTNSTKAYEYYEFAITLNRLGIYDLARDAIDKALLLQNDDIVLFEDKTYQVSKEPRRLYNELKKEIIRRM